METGIASTEVIQSLNGLLQWLTGSGGGAWLVVMFFVSWIMEKVGWWEKLSPQAKSAIMLLTAGLLGAGAVWLGKNPDIVAAIDPYFRPLMYATMIWLTSQFAHGTNPLRSK